MATMRKGEDGAATVPAAVADLWLKGAAIKWAAPPAKAPEPSTPPRMPRVTLKQHACLAFCSCMRAGKTLSCALLEDLALLAAAGP